MEVGKIYTIITGNHNVTGRLLEETEESILLEYAMVIVPISQKELIPMPLDRFGEQKTFPFSKYLLASQWEAGKTTEKMFESYVKERKASEVGLVYASSMNDIKI
jgi:hypothetical protein